MNLLVPVKARTDTNPVPPDDFVDVVTALVACLGLVLLLAQVSPWSTAAAGIVLLVVSVGLLFGARPLLR
jgi:hypothetical protein